MTTTKTRYVVLDKFSSSYTFHRSFTTKDVKCIPEDVEKFLKSRFKWGSKSNPFYIEYYSPNGPLPEGPKSKERIEQTVNDDYLEHNCRKIDFDGLGDDTKRQIIAVGFGVDVEVKFHVFVRIGSDKRVAYTEEGTACGELGAIMDLVKDKAKQMVWESHGTAHISRVYKAKKTIEKDVLQEFESKGGAWRTSVVEPFEGLPEDGSSLVLILEIDMRKVNFHVYIRAGEDEPTIYAGREFVQEEPRKVMGLIKEKAEKMARTYEDVSPDVSVTRFYKLSESSTPVRQRNFGTKGQISTMPEGDPLEGIPDEKSSLIVEIVTHTYKYAVFRKQDSGYIFSGLRSVHGLPEQSLEALVVSVSDHFKGLNIPTTANISVSVWEPRGDFRDKSPQGWKGVQLTTENFGKDLLECSRSRLFRVLPRTLVVVFEVSSSALDTIPEEHHVDREKVAMLARERESPSTESKLSTLLDTQREHRLDAVYNNRPHQLIGAPVQLYHPAFANFIREISQPVENVNFSHEELDQAADFIYASLDFLRDERWRHPYLNEKTTVLCSSGEEAVVRIVELKSEIGEGDSDPIAQAECRFVLICCSKAYTPFRDASCCPMFLVGVAGPNLAISGAVFTERFVSQRFTDYIYLGPLPGGGNETALSHRIRRVAQILRALEKSTTELEEYYKSLEFQFPPAPEPRRLQSCGTPRSSTRPTPLHPIRKVVPPHFQAYTDDGRTYKIEYTERLASDFPSKAVFKGTVEYEEGEDKVKQDVVIKFTDTYGEEGHKLLAEASLAPKLWFCKHEPSVGMYVVVMEYVSGKQAGVPLTDEGHVNRLQTVMDRLHGEGYAHGDIRGSNLLIAEDGLKLIDFDWCGKAGVARYPVDISIGSGIQWHEGVPIVLHRLWENLRAMTRIEAPSAVLYDLPRLDFTVSAKKP